MAEQAKHAPTPWFIDADFHKVRFEGAKSWESICLEGFALSMNGGDDTEPAANTRFIVRAVNAHDDLVDSLRELVAIIDAAGLHQLSRGVELGTTSWYIKASDRMEAARAAIAKATIPGANDAR